MATQRWKGLPAALAISVLGCGDETRTISIEVTTGHETGAFAEDPPVTRVDVTASAVGGGSAVTASAAPGGTLDFGEIPADELLGFDVEGVGADGAPLVRGRSIAGIYLPALEGDVLPLFAQRSGAWARPPGALGASRVGAPAGVLAERYVVLTGGGAAAAGDNVATLEAYDLLAWGGAGGTSLPRIARSLVARGGAVLLIDDAGATWVDLTSGDWLEADAPAGLTTFAEVAGGRTIESTDGRSFIVGASRADGAPTAGVLVVETDGTLTGAQLAEPRAGAAVVWVDGLGLVVAGGSGDGDGVEVLGDGATAFTGRPFPPDPTVGAGAVVLGLGEVALVGGTIAGAPAPTRQLDPACGTACAAAEVDGAALPAALTGTAAYALAGTRIVAVGQEAAAGGLTRSFVVDLGGSGVTELALREPRAGATAAPAPNGTLALLGGVHPDGTPALTVEMLFPE